MIPSIWGITAVKFIETESRIVIAKGHGQGEGVGGLLFNRYRVLILQDEKSSGDGFHNNVMY